MPKASEKSKAAGSPIYSVYPRGAKATLSVPFQSIRMIELKKIGLSLLMLVLLAITFTPVAAEGEPVSALAANVQAPDTSLPEHLMEEGVFLVISKSANVLSVMVNGRTMYSFPVATGRRKELTPSGRFHIVTKIEKPYYVRKQIPGGHPNNPLGSRWMGLNVPGTGGYKYGIHGTNRPWSIGGSVSSGCIRMHNKDVEWLFRHIPLGTVVIIKD